MGHIRLCVPEVVIREQVAHYRQTLIEAQGFIRRGNSGLRRAGAQGIAREDIEDAEIAAALQAYEDWLRTTIENCGEVLTIPSVDHSTLVDAALSARKPFSRGDKKGYKDALIWFSIVTAAGDGPLALVTDDTSDFFAKDGKDLDSDLLTDLENAGLQRDAVRPMTDLDLVIREYLPDNPDALEAFAAFAGSPDGMERIREVISGMFSMEQRVPISAKPGVLPPWLFDQDIEEFQAILTITAESARPLDSEDFLVTGQIEGVAYIGGLVWAREAFEGRSVLSKSAWEVWDTLGDQYYISHPQAQQVVADFAVRFRPPAHVENLHIDQARLMTDELAPIPPYSRSSPPNPGAPPVEQARWLELEISRLRRATSREYLWAVRDEGFIADLSDVLTRIEPSVAQHLSEDESVSLAIDNVGFVLEKRGGLTAAVDALKKLLDRLEES